MSKVKVGDEVVIHYRAQARDRRIVGGGSASVKFVVGNREVFGALDNAVIGMRVGEKKSLSIAASDAFGVAREQPAERAIPRSRLPANVRVGDALRITRGEESALLWVIGEGGGDTWRLSSAHPFAGQDLTLQIELLPESKTIPGISSCSQS